MHAAPVAHGVVGEWDDGDEADRSALRKFDQPGEAAAFFMAQRLAPGQDAYPLEQVIDALRAVRERAALRSAEHPGDITSWDPLGPGNIGGRTRALAIDPATPTTMYAAGVNGGVWQSTDAGASWAPLDDFLPNIAVSTIAIDATNTDILYAGTGEGVGGSSTFPRGLGIFKSTDGGVTWTLLDGTVNGVPAGAFHYVNKIVISPNDAARLYAATRTGVWRSLDAGASWALVLANPRYLSGAQQTNGCSVGALDLVVRSDTNPDTLLAAFGSFEKDGLYRSTDGGDTWSEIVTGANQGRMALAIAPSDNDVMYISMADNGSGAPTGQLVNVFRSTDGGVNWEGRVDFNGFVGPWLLSNLVTATGCIASPLYSQGWHDNAIAVDPTNPDVVWVGGIDLFRSDDGGRTFGIGAYWFAEQVASIPNTRYAHADQHIIVFHPDYDGVTNATMYAGNDGGLYRTDNALDATTQEDCPFGAAGPLPDILWTNLNNGYAVTQFYHGDSAKQTDRFAGGAQDNGTSKTESRAGANAWVSIGGGDGGYVAIDPRDPDVIFTEIQGFPTIRKSTNGGASSFPATGGITDTDGLFITPFAIDERNPDILWTGGRRPWRTTNSAASWQVAGIDLPAAATISAIAVAPSDSNVVYLGYSNGHVARSTNALDASPTWVLSSSGLPSGFAWVSSMAVDPRDPDIAYASYSTFGVGHVYRTANGGASWTRIDGVGGSDPIPDIPVHWIAVRPTDSAQLYAATELGVFASDDTGATWRPTGPGMPNTVVESLDWKGPDTLVAFTHGRGAFIADLIPGCTADLNADGAVDGVDLGLLLGNWGLPNGDLNGDGATDGADLGLLLAAWGPCA
ncbi:MAG: hypothetical protein ACF8QF_02255 [Phycisphaerales bacterium]